MTKAFNVWIVRDEDRPDDNTTIWKYMKYEHFIDLITSQSLYFIRIADLQTTKEPEGDKYEGVETETTLKVIDSVRQKNLAILRSTTREVTYPRDFTWDGYIDRIKAFEKEQDNLVYVCYFHINENENKEMWVRSDHNIAIKSTYGKLIKSLQSKGYVGINPVYYVEESTIVSPYHGLGKYFIKRKKFEHEHELRIIADYSYRKNTECIDKNHLGVDLGFIDEVVTKDEELIYKIQNLLKENTLSVNVTRSRELVG